MNIYYNAEYTGAHEEAHLISMGFIAEDGRGLYLEFKDVPSYSINAYVFSNILPDTYIYDSTFTDPEIAAETAGSVCHANDQDFRIVTTSNAGQVIQQWFKELLSSYPQGETIQLVSYCCHYDACLFYNLFRGETPEYINMICYDIVGSVMHYMTDWVIDIPFSARLKDTLKNSNMEELAQKLGHPVRTYEKSTSIKYAEVIKNVYEGLEESRKG